MLGWGLLGMALTVATSSAAIIAEDSFYTGGGTLNGRNGGSGWGGAWVTNGLGNHATCVDSTSASLQFTSAGGASVRGASWTPVRPPVA